jgi:hypothetical protein
MRTGTLLIACLIVFGLLSLTDFTQTFALISTGNGEVYESNPVASAWLEQHGWLGLGIFKAGTVAVFVGAAVLVARRRPHTGVGVAALGCAALLAVTGYSHDLLSSPPGSSSHWELASDQSVMDGQITVSSSSERMTLANWPPAAIAR